jgi:DNA-binding CsgD family transcriptional regulator
MNDLDYMAFVEACYRIEQPELDWLTGVAEAAVPLMGFGEGIHAYLVDLSLPAPLTHPILVEGRDAWQAAWRLSWWDNFMAKLSPDHVKVLHTLSPVNFTSDLFGAVQQASPSFGTNLPPSVTRRYSTARARFSSGQMSGPAQQAAARGPSGFRYPDSFNVSGLDAAGRGAILIANMPELADGAVSPSDIALWSRLGAHIAAGHRLNRKHRTPSDELAGVDAVIEPNGHLAHVATELRDTLALAALRERVVAVDRARANDRHARNDWHTTTGVWTGLAEGRWSLVDRFDRDGRRYYLARPNLPDATHDLLGPREAQVAHAAALGHSNKHIAYELGVSISTVATHLKSAATKLGVSSRVELIQRMRLLHGPPES